MNQTLITSIENSLSILSSMVDQQNLPAFDVKNLKRYTENELRAIDEFLQKSLVSISRFYRDYAKLLETLNSKQLTLFSQIKESEAEYKKQKEIKKIRRKLIRSS